MMGGGGEKNLGRGANARLLHLGVATVIGLQKLINLLLNLAFLSILVLSTKSESTFDDDLYLITSTAT